MAACDGCEQPEPAAEFCDMLTSCEGAKLLVGVDECSAQVQATLGLQQRDCKSCVFGLPCEGVQDVLAGSKSLQGLCPGCNEEVVDPTHPLDEAPASPYLIIPALVAGSVELSEDEAERDQQVRDQAAGLCEAGEDCDQSILLVSTDECTEQIYNILKQEDDTCRRCAASLSCAGIEKVVSGQVPLELLCRSCRLDAARVCAAGDKTCAAAGVGPHLLIAGFVQAPPPPPEEGEASEEDAEESADETPTAEVATPAPPAAPRPEPAAPVPTEPVPAQAAPAS